jgi:hypothetical protein
MGITTNICGDQFLDNPSSAAVINHHNNPIVNPCGDQLFPYTVEIPYEGYTHLLHWLVNNIPDGGTKAMHDKWQWVTIDRNPQRYIGFKHQEHATLFELTCL